ncbi:MAG TPA: lysylphosphatidylglycerol synthase transmembrane domain-containing protein [Chloroflexota bacterium]|nr:lysylphosphatidylglycerol synthase transmembrane domain-containing protein [Chloroflexota bacterium]
MTLADGRRTKSAQRIPWGLILKVGIAVAVTAYVLSRAGLGEAVVTLRSAQWSVVALAAVFATVAMVLNVTRWRMMIAAQGSNAPLTTLVRLYLVGMFFNNILPSRFGADVVRAYGAAGVAAGRTRSVASVVMDRLVGAISVLILGLVAVVIRPTMIESRLGQSLVLMFVALVAVLAMLMYRSERTSRFRDTLLRLADVSFFGIRLRGRVDAAIDAMRSYAGARGLIMRALIISLFANGLSIVNLYLYGTAVGAGLSLGDVAAAAPIILAVGLLPLSINGLGTVELAFVVLFGAMGVPDSTALAIAILRRVVLLGMSLVGGVLYTVKKFG